MAPSVNGIEAPHAAASGKMIGVHTAGMLQIFAVAKHTKPTSTNVITGNHAALMNGVATEIR